MNPLSLESGRVIALYGLTLAIAVKFVLEALVGSRQYIAVGSFTAYSNERYADEGLANRLTRRSYCVAYTVKWVALCVLPLGGWATVVGAVLLSVWFFRIEIAYDYKHHTIFLGLFSALLAFAGPGGLMYSPTTSTQTVEPEVMATICLCLLYLSSAVIKLKNPRFVDGSVLQHLFYYWQREGARMRRKEVVLPGSLVRAVDSLTPATRGRTFRALSMVAIAWEIVLIPLIVAPGTWGYAITLALIMHLAFTTLFVWRLIPFCIAVISLYCMVPPWR